MFPISKLHPSKNALEHEVIQGFIFKLFYYQKKTGRNNSCKGAQNKPPIKMCHLTFNHTKQHQMWIKVNLETGHIIPLKPSTFLSASNRKS